MTYTTRREFLDALAFASIGGILPASTKGTSSVKSSSPDLEKRDFGPVRDRILKEIAGGAATGVAVAVVHKGQIIWEEGPDAFRRGGVHRSVHRRDRLPGCKTHRSEDAATQADSARGNAGGQDSRNRLQNCDAALRSHLESITRLNTVRREITLGFFQPSFAANRWAAECLSA